ncbi:MAG: Uma2 family endonuclease [Saprospiraceae bacterium]|nr:Uma2 family endonuclease [Saprospiraceae bacterium]
MEVAVKMPITLKERLEMGEELRIPASWEEFLDMLEECEYRIEYDEHEIISFMGYGTQNHEKIIIKLGQLLLNLLNDDEFSVYGSNLALHIPGFTRRYYNGDVTVVQGPSEEVVLRGSMVAVANPVLIVEVLSDSTRNFDLGTKQRNYRKIPSLQQILTIESTEMFVTSCTRDQSTGQWSLKDFTAMDEVIPILGEGSIKMEDLYRKLSF